MFPGVGGWLDELAYGWEVVEVLRVALSVAGVRSCLVRRTCVNGRWYGSCDGHEKCLRTYVDGPTGARLVEMGHAASVHEATYNRGGVADVFSSSVM